MYICLLTLSYLSMPGTMTLTEFHDCWRAEVALFPVALGALVQVLLRVKITFQVTAQAKAHALKLDKFATPSLLLLVATATACISIAMMSIGLPCILSEGSLCPLPTSRLYFYVTSMIWAFFNLYQIWPMIRAVLFPNAVFPPQQMLERLDDEEMSHSPDAILSTCRGTLLKRKEAVRAHQKDADQEWQPRYVVVGRQGNKSRVRMQYFSDYSAYKRGESALGAMNLKGAKLVQREETKQAVGFKPRFRIESGKRTLVLQVSASGASAEQLRLELAAWEQMLADAISEANGKSKPQDAAHVLRQNRLRNRSRSQAVLTGNHDAVGGGSAGSTMSKWALGDAYDDMDTDGHRRVAASAVVHQANAPSREVEMNPLRMVDENDDGNHSEDELE